MVTKVLVLITIMFVAQVSTETYDVNCDPQTNTEFPKVLCQSESLETIAAHAQVLTNLHINLKVHELQLTSQVNFTNLSSLVIIDEPNLTTLICNSSRDNGAGIVLSETAEITLKNLHLKFCGSYYVNKFRDNKVFTSALTLVHCITVEMSGIIIAQGKGIGLMILNHHKGEVNINSSEFKENELSPEYTEKSIFGGGGVYILLIGRLQETVYLPMNLHFHNCTFKSNRARTKQYKFHYTNVNNERRAGYGRGGGVHLSIMQGISNVSVSFSDCLFSNNEAFIGGGMSVKTYIGMTNQTMTNIEVQITNSMFKENGCAPDDPAYQGGAACFAFTTYTYGSAITDSHYFIWNVSFISNCGKIGGGINYLSDRNRNINVDSFILFENCNFTNNAAYFGSAVFMSPNVFKKLSLGIAMAPTFTNCHFKNNSVSKSTTIYSWYGTKSTVGIGTVYASGYNIDFQGHNHFVSNWGTAVYVINGMVNFKNSSAHFINNTGTQGGALALIGSSVLIFGTNTYSFINNTAYYEGGAIYVMLIDNTDFLTSRSCFFQYEDNESESTPSSSITWNSNITFLGNVAKNRTFGHAVYAASVHCCEVISNGTTGYNNYNNQFVDPSQIFTIRGIEFDSDPLLQPQIATDGALLHSSKQKPTLQTVIPGQKYEHGVVITDDLNQQVETIFVASIERKVKNVHLDFSFIGDKVRLRGKPGEVATIYLQTVSQRKSYVRLKVKLTDCPPGFALNNKLECICRAYAYWGMIKCNLKTFQTHLIYGFWAGQLPISQNRTELVTAGCPFFDYGNSLSIDSEFEVILPQSYSELSKSLCGETRTGIICGRCQENYTVHFHSPNFLCKPVSDSAGGCRLGWLFYILSELVPVTIVFITVLVFNISFTSGAVNGFILFGQLLNTLDIDTSGIINLPDSAKESIRGWTRGYQAIYGFINLDYFSYESLSFCLWKDASALDMLAVKYITILYTLLMILVFILVLNKCTGRCCGKCCRITTVRTSIIHGISTFLVICYSQCIKVSLSLLTPVQLQPEKNNMLMPSRRLWYNGEVLYFSRNHLPYALPALFFLCTIGMIPPALLLSYPLLNKLMALFGCENCKFLDCITFSCLKPLLDCFQGCFKDNYRFFSGLYFLYRWAFQCFYMTKGFSPYYTGVAGFLLFALVLHSIASPTSKQLTMS